MRQASHRARPCSAAPRDRAHLRTRVRCSRPYAHGESALEVTGRDRSLCWPGSNRCSTSPGGVVILSCRRSAVVVILSRVHSRRCKRSGASQVHSSCRPASQHYNSNNNNKETSKQQQQPQRAVTAVAAQHVEGGSSRREGGRAAVRLLSLTFVVLGDRQLLSDTPVHNVVITQPRGGSIRKRQ